MGACWGRDSTSGGDANNGDQQQQKAQERRTTPAVIHAPPSPQQLQELQPVPSLPLPEAFRSLASREGADDIPGNPTHATAPPAASCVPPQPHPVVQQELQSLLQLPLPEAFRSLASRAGADDIPGNPTHATASPAASSVPPQPQPVVQQELQALLPLPLPEASRSLASRADPDDIPGKPTHASRVSQQPQPVVQQEPPPVVHRLPLPTVFRSSHPRSEPINILGKQFEDVLSHFTIGKELGRGRFGITYLCHERTTGNQYACKTFPKWKLASKSDQDDVRTEVAIMQDVSGQLNIVEFKGAYEDANSVHLVMEMCDGGELFDRITAKGSYSEREVAGVFRSIAVVVNVCHLLGVMHRDMKPENLLLVGKGKRAKLKLTNFGLSAYIKEGKVFRDVVGSPYYIAPEVLKRRSGKEADVWSAGVILYILLCGAPPFCAKNEKGICDAILKGDIDFESTPWPYISDSAKDLIKKMLTQDPKERITAVQVLEHPWIREDGTAPDILLDSAVVTSLRQFRAMNKLKKTALKVIAEKLSEEDIKGMKQMFISMDTESNDTITYDELIIGLGQFKSKFSENEVKQLLEAVHINGNGSIDYNEFITATMHRHRLERDDYLHRTFQSFDKDNSGFITRDELELIMKEHGIGGDEAGIKDIISKVDIENDGRINFAEFRDMMISGMQQQQQQQQQTPPPEVGGS